jgi:hypothetical protein
LSLAEQDRHRNELDEVAQTFIYQSTREIIEELAEPTTEPPTEEATENSPELSSSGIEGTGPIDVLCIPARDEADDVVGRLLAQLLERNGHKAQSISIGTTAEMLSQVAELNPGVVCISALPPFAVNHARALYAKLRTQSPNLYIALCLWHFEGDVQKATNQLKLSKGHGFFTTLPQVMQHIAFHTGEIASGPSNPKSLHG